MDYTQISKFSPVSAFVMCTEQPEPLRRLYVSVVYVPQLLSVLFDIGVGLHNATFEQKCIAFVETYECAILQLILGTLTAIAISAKLIRNLRKPPPSPTAHSIAMSVIDVVCRHRMTGISETMAFEAVCRCNMKEATKEQKQKWKEALTMLRECEPRVAFDDSTICGLQTLYLTWRQINTNGWEGSGNSTLCGRIFWGIVLVVCFIGAIANFYAVFSDYLKRQTATLFTIKQQRKLLFPSITFCPKNVDALNFRNIQDDIYSTLGNVSRVLTYRLITLVLTGSGFNSLDGITVDVNLADKNLHEAYDKWRGSRSHMEMFELFFDRSGYRCEDSQIVAYISNQKDDIAMFNRYYLSLNEWNRMRFRLRETKMLPGREGCVQRERGVGRATCFVENWHKKVVQRFKCALFYLRSKTPNYPVCDPFTIAENYRVLVNFSTEPITCLPSCIRYDHTVDVFSSELATTREADRSVFHLEASYTDLQYELIEEVLTTTLPGFVSQIGGQFGLFLGISLMSLVQFGQTLILYCRKKIRTFLRLKYTLRVRE
ncbi:hypothetical protein QR680_002935 [Steinernema hermaphroditum]|uniref:Amiloride-sensitive sodium channel n=1 Tax=Steinernema hermaphroditum TaxID=289476 RepID=A0AA39LJC6_9BILA|nr:hypothetical protein QR680_002935 [Steinernema hermaphroditum]